LGAGSLVLTGALLVACTTTAGTAEAPTAAPTTGAIATATPPSGGTSPTAASVTSGAATDSGAGTGTGSGTGGSAAGSTAAASAGTGTAATAGTGAADTSPAIPPVGYATDPAAAALEAVLPGMYGLDSLGATVSGTSVTIDAPSGCAFVIEVLGAGQWTVSDLVKPGKGDNQYLAELSSGAKTAALTLTDNGDSCQGTITQSVPATLAISGALSESGAAKLFPMACLPAQTGSTLLYGIYTTAKAAYLVGFGVPSAVGTHTGKGADDAALLFYRASKTGPDVGAGLKALEEATSSSALGAQDGVLPGWDPSGVFGATGVTTATGTVTAAKPLSGTVTVSNAANPRNPSSTIAIKASFTCNR
jgi:hypothetical protein